MIIVLIESLINYIPANTKHLYNIYGMLEKHRRWPTLYKCCTNVLGLLRYQGVSVRYHGDVIFLSLV